MIALPGGSRKRRQHLGRLGVKGGKRSNVTSPRTGEVGLDVGRGQDRVRVEARHPDLGGELLVGRAHPPLP